MSSEPPIIEASASAPPMEAPHSDALVNPASGLANDYLNLFNELVLMLEQIPEMPELLDDLLAWKPVSYQDYFHNSKLRGGPAAIKAYGRLSPAFRRRFETFVAELDLVAVASVAAARRLLRSGAPADAERAYESCRRAAQKMRIILLRASRLVSYAAVEDEEYVAPAGSFAAFGAR